MKKKPRNAGSARSSYGWKAEELAELTQGTWLVMPENDAWRAGHIAIDAHITEENTVFVAMDRETWLTGAQIKKTSHFKDSHLLVPQVQDKICGAIVQRPIPELPAHMPQLLVKDSYAVINTLARAARSKMTGKILAITGTVGKSTTKGMIAHLLQGDHVVATNRGNHNTRTWADLIVANCKNNPDFCVLEASLDTLWQSKGSVCTWLKPHLSIITHIGTGHTNVCGTVKRVAYYKTKICEGIQEGGKVLLYRGMDEFDYVRKQVAEYGATPLTYGLDNDCDSFIRTTESSNGTLHVWASILGTDIDYSLNQIGQSNAINSIAALTAIQVLGFDPASLVKRLSSYKANDNVLDLFETPTPSGKVTILDDGHNSQILSIINAINTFQSEADRLGGSGRRVVILGETLYLGEQAASAYASLAEPLMAAHVDQLFAESPVLRPLLEKLPPAMVGGIFNDASSCVHAALEYIRDGDYILLKGDRETKDFAKVRTLLVKGLARPDQKAAPQTQRVSCAAWSLDTGALLDQNATESAVAEGLGSVLLLYLALDALYKKTVALADAVEVGEKSTVEKNCPNALGLSKEAKLPFGSLLAAMITSNAPDATLALAEHLRKVHGKPIRSQYADIAARIGLEAHAYQNITGRRHTTHAQHFTVTDLGKLAQRIFSRSCDVLKPLRTTFVAHNGVSLETNSDLHCLSGIMHYYCFGDQTHNAIASAGIHGENVCLCACGAQTPFERDCAIANMLFALKNRRINQ